MTEEQQAVLAATASALKEAVDTLKLPEEMREAVMQRIDATEDPRAVERAAFLVELMQESHLKGEHAARFLSGEALSIADAGELYQSINRNPTGQDVATAPLGGRRTALDKSPDMPVPEWGRKLAERYPKAATAFQANPIFPQIVVNNKKVEGEWHTIMQLEGNMMACNSDHDRSFTGMVKTATGSVSSHVNPHRKGEDKGPYGTSTPNQDDPLRVTLAAEVQEKPRTLSKGAHEALVTRAKEMNFDCLKPEHQITQR